MKKENKMKVVDMVMGAGKTSAMINFINASDPDTHFLFITPYLTEVERIQEACPAKNFKDPKGITGSKLDGLKNLIQRGENIVSTHALFQRFDRELIELCRVQNYILVMDEVAEVIEPYDIAPSDFKTMLEKYAYIEEGTDFIRWRDDADYDDNKGKAKFAQEKILCELNCLVYYGGSSMMWLFPVEAFKAFREVYILTYMFDAQMQKYYYDYYGFSYTNVYVAGDSLETYHLTENEAEKQAVEQDYESLIHICDDERLNLIGAEVHSLSKNWYQRSSARILAQVKNNIYTYFVRRRGAKSTDSLWTTFKSYRSNIRVQGYGRAFLSLNTRASNKYRKRKNIAYVVNRYMNTGIKNFFVKNGITVDEDRYALSEMLQFIWRSAIRDGKEIGIYVPSARMRGLLKSWITENSVTKREKEIA